MVTGLPRKLDESIFVQHIGSETLVYDERRHQAFCLNASSAAVWNLADGTRTPAQIAEGAALSLGAPVTTTFVEFALAELRRDGLLAEPAMDLEPLSTAAAVSRRNLLKTLGTSSALLLPVVAAVLAPRAAQAYGGCFDCTSSALTTRQRMQIRAAQADAAARQQSAVPATSGDQ